MAETNTPSSFIPHDTGEMSPVRRSSGGGLHDLALLCAIVLLVASVALAAGVFLYQQYLATEKASKIADLERTKDNFDSTLINTFMRLEDRMGAADIILKAHIAPTAFLSALQQATLVTVSFQTMSFEAPDPQNIKIKMAGTAQSVNSIALQADLFSKNNVITGPIFSNIARQQDGVHFNLEAAVHAPAINYSGLVAGVQNTGLQNPMSLPGVTQPSSMASSSPTIVPASTTAPMPTSTPRI